MREVPDAFHTLRWQALFGQVPPASKRAHDFGWSLVQRSGYEQCQELLRFFASWEHYHLALYLTLQEFQAVAREYIEGLEAPKPKGVRTVPVEEMSPEGGALVVWATIIKDDMTVAQSDPQKKSSRRLSGT